MNSEGKKQFERTEMSETTEEWKEKRIGDEIELCYGKGLPATKRKMGKIPVFGSNGVVGYHNEFLVKGPGVIIGRKGSVGEVKFSTESFWPIDTTYFLKLKDKGDIRFWYYFLLTLKLNKMNTHSAVPGLNRDTVLQVKRRIPEFIEQQEIAKILSNLDLKIEVNQRMNRTLEAIGQAIFERWFVDFEFPNEEGKPYKSSGGEFVYNEKLGREIPKKWKVKTLDEISLNFDSKRVPLSSREREKVKGNYPYYGAAGILDYVDDFIFDGTYVLMGEDGTVVDERGYPFLQFVRGRFWVNNHAHALQGNGIPSELLYLFLKNTNVQHIVTGAVQPKINQANMNTLAFAIPDDASINRLQAIITKLRNIVFTNLDQAATLAQIRDLLLPKLMSGKIRVPVPKESAEVS
jgi:type I restriction enzyme S subunit